MFRKIADALQWVPSAWPDRLHFHTLPRCIGIEQPKSRIRFYLCLSCSNPLNARDSA